MNGKKEDVERGEFSPYFEMRLRTTGGKWRQQPVNANQIRFHKSSKSAIMLSVSYDIGSGSGSGARAEFM
jgi:hypothetical protein